MTDNRDRLSRLAVMRFAYWVVGSLVLVLSWFALPRSSAVVLLAYLTLSAVTVGRPE